MRSILLVLGIAAAAVVISVVTQNSRQLSPAPQDDIARKTEAEQKAAWQKADAEQRTRENEAAAAFKPPLEGAVKAVLKIAGKGDIVLELYPKAAPKTVARFIELANAGFYNGIKVHRVEANFVVQAGDPKTRDIASSALKSMTDAERAAEDIGGGGSGQKTPFEKNELTHIRGSVAMALSAPQSSTADSQFFINLKLNPSLNGDYCVFGRVIEGEEIVGKLVQGDVIESLSSR